MTTTEKPSTRFIDGVIAYRILRMLTRPFDETLAYKYGIIDEKGKLLKKEKDLKTTDEKNAYTLLHRLVFRLKRIIEKVPTENKKLLSYAAALALIRENYENGIEPIEFESMLFEKLNTPIDTTLVEQFMDNRTIATLKQFMEDAPMNAVSGPAGSPPPIAGMGVGGPNDVAVPPGNKLTIQRRKKVLNAEEDYPYTDYTVQKNYSPRS